MRELSIDPTQLPQDDSDSSSEIREIFDMIIKCSSSPEIPDGQFILELTDVKEEILIDLKYSLLIRPKHSQNNMLRVQVMANQPFARGGLSVSTKSLGILIPEQKYRFEPDERLCKKIPITPDITKEDIINESNVNQINPQLHCKDPVFTKEHGFIVTRFIKGVDLFELLKNVSLGEIKLSVEQRLKLTIAIFEAYKTQVRDIGIIHRDLKPENIIIDIENMTVTIIDPTFAVQALAADEEMECNQIRGSYDFLAPEFILHAKMSQQSDVFAIGLIVAQVWGDISSFVLNDMVDKEEITPEKILHHINNRSWIGLFDNLDLTKGMQLALETLFNSLIDIDPTERRKMSMELAINTGEEILSNYLKSEQNTSMVDPHSPLLKTDKIYGIIKSKKCSNLNFLSGLNRKKEVDKEQEVIGSPMLHI